MPMLPTLIRRFNRFLAGGLAFAMALSPMHASAQFSVSGQDVLGNPSNPATGGLIYLRQGRSTVDQRGTSKAPGQGLGTPAPDSQQPLSPQAEQREARPGDDRPYPGQKSRPSEFERYVQKITNSFEVRRLGAELVIDSGMGTDTDVLDVSPVVPSDYVIAPGDEVLVSIWGAVDADLRLVVDRSGRLQVPRVGAVLVAGVKYQDLAATIERQARKVFKNFELSASMGQLRGVRVFVTGFAERPGAYSVSSLASVSSVLFRAGGPSSAGSFRNIELRRRGQVVAKLDLYDLIVFGRRDVDQLVQAADVIHVGPVGPQVAMIGSVNKPAIVELKAGETVANALQMAGDFNTVADRTRLALERLDERSDRRVRQLAWPLDKSMALETGDVVRVFSAVAATQPLQRQARRVQVDGEVLRPGEYILPPSSGINDLVRLAGGFTPLAFVYGAEFTRESVRRQQQANFDRMLRDVEVDVVRANNSNAGKTADATARQEIMNDRLLQRLRDIKPSGRVVMQVPLDASELPDLALEDGDRLFVPAMPTSVAVFGSVYNAGNYLFGGQRSIEDYLRLAGSATRNADEDSTFVVRANGSVESARQLAGWIGGGSSQLGKLQALPGDTIFVPDEVNKPLLSQTLKDWAQIVYQFGLGVAAVRTLAR
jgi:protein involved in polysaccharide export with SLBB domain